MVDILKKMPTLFKMGINMLPKDLVKKYNLSGINLWDKHGEVSENFYDCILEYIFI